MTQKKIKFPLWMTPEAREIVETHYKADNNANRSEYIEKAIRFYSGYLDVKNAGAYLPHMLSEVLESKLGAFGDRLGKQLFKLAVNDGMLTHIEAAGLDVDPAALDKLRVQCMNETRQTHGVIDLEDALRFEREL